MDSYQEKSYAPIIAPRIINECLNRGYIINTSKLMKLLYYMQKFHIQKFGETMFTNNIVVTKNGPFIPDINEYFAYGKLGFDKKFHHTIPLKDSHDFVLNLILDQYGSLSPSKLMEESIKDTIGYGLEINQIIPFNIMTNKPNYNKKILSRKQNNINN